MNRCGHAFVAVSWMALFAGLTDVSQAQPLRLPDEFPIPMAFRPLESGDSIDKLAPFPIIHAGPIADIKKRWPDKICILHRP